MLKHIILQQRDKLILLVFPLLLIAINSNWIFTPVTNYLPDPWFYLGYFRYFNTYAPAFPSNVFYFVERLTWNVPGFYIYQLFPPLLANYVLHLIVYYVAVFCLYGTLSLLFNQRTALISALLMSGYPWFLRAVGWDYTDGTGIAHVLLLIYLLTLAHYSEKHRIWLALAGAVYASLLITNLFWISYSPSWAVYFLILNLQSRKFKLPELILVLAYFLFGFLIPVGLTALYYQQVTGDFVFLKNSIMAAISLTDDTTNVKNVQIIYGHMRPYWHVLPAILAALGAWRMATSQRDRHTRAYVAVFFLFLLAYGWLIFWNFYSIPLLIIFTYSSFVMPSIFLLLGATIFNSGVFEGVSEEQLGKGIGATIILMSFPFALTRIVPGVERLLGGPFLIAGVSLLLLAALIVRNPKTSILKILIMFTLLFFLVGEKAYVYDSDSEKGRDHYLAVIAASDIIDEQFPNRQYSDFRLWFRADENYDTFFSFSALYLYPWGSVINVRHSRQEPPERLAIAERDQFEQDNAIVILSSNFDAIEVVNEANEALSSRNARIELETSHAIRQGNIRFVLYFTRVSMQP